jgi:hypothetical protein
MRGCRDHHDSNTTAIRICNGFTINGTTVFTSSRIFGYLALDLPNYAAPSGGPVSNGWMWGS